MRVVAVPVLHDNYSYLLLDQDGTALAVDPAEPGKVLRAAQEQGARLAAVLTTHRHSDHAGGGNVQLAQQVPQLAVIGGATEAVPGCTLAVADGEELAVGCIKIRCLETPYHTLGHVCYLCWEEGSDEQVLFTGDALFIGGCGRCFQGTLLQMYHSLIEVIAALPPETLLYCGHEYTVANLEWAEGVDPGNQALQQKLRWARQQRQAGLPTVPSTLAEELTYNPFLRCCDPVLQRRCLPGKASQPGQRQQRSRCRGGRGSAGGCHRHAG